MPRILLVIFMITLLLFKGCSGEVQTPQDGNAEINENNGKVTLLADIDFAIVPDFIYYVLLEEKMEGSTVFVRRYVCYDGFEDTVSEKLQRIRLPVSVSDTAEARSIFQENDTAELELLQPAYVSESVFSRWEEEEYEYSVEESGIISLEELQKKCAISRLNKMFAISVNSDELAASIQEAKEEYLQTSSRLQMQEELKPLPQSFTYSGLLFLYDEVQRSQSPPLATASVKLSYQIDELGNPLELEFVTSFNQLHSGTSCIADINKMEEFVAKLRDIFVKHLNLYGVNSHNNSLAYANVTLCYEEKMTEREITKKIYIR